MKYVRSLVAIVALLSASACNDVLGNNDGNFAFQVIPINYDPALTEGAEITVLLRTVQIDGIVVLPDGCHQVTGDHRLSGGVIVLTVTARPGTAACPAAIQQMQYRAQSLGLSRGVHRIRVVHVIGSAAPRVLLEEDVILE